jgi:hypothetical protein
MQLMKSQPSIGKGILDGIRRLEDDPWTAVLGMKAPRMSL